MDSSKYKITIYSRNKVFYARFYDTKLKRDIAERSITKLAIILGYNTSRKITKSNANEIALMAIKKGIIGSQGANISFIKYLIEFWTWDKSAYIKEKNALNPNHIGKDHASNMLSCIKNHIEPLFSDKIKLNEVDGLLLKDVIFKYFNTSALNLSPATKNKILQSVKKPLAEAKKNKLITEDPSVIISYFSTKKQKEAGLLTEEEVTKLFYCLKQNLKKNTNNSENLKAYLLIMLAFITGERPGEIRALTVDSINLQKDYAIILVNSAISRSGEVKLPKNKKARENAVPISIATNLVNLAKQCPIEGNKNVFWSKKKPNQPISASHAREIFYDAIGKIGIGHEERVKRNLILYGARHYFNNTMRFVLSPDILRA